MSTAADGGRFLLALLTVALLTVALLILTLGVMTGGQFMQRVA